MIKKSLFTYLEENKFIKITRIPNVNNGLILPILTWIFCPSSCRIYEEDHTFPFSKQSTIVQKMHNPRYQVGNMEKLLCFCYSLEVQHGHAILRKQRKTKINLTRHFLFYNMLQLSVLLYVTDIKNNL